VLEILLRRHSAVGAYDIIDSMEWGDRRRASSVVYRALDFLAANGLVHKLHSRNAFIACSHPDEGHGAQFLICTRCDRIAEIADRKVERGVIAAASVAGFTVRRPMIEIEGLCPHCGG
jgi:Fur family zinc uptake transcriptional regulator